MTCEQVSPLLPDYFVRALGDGERNALEAHLEQCAECRAQVAIWEKLALLPEQQPSPMLRGRFDAMLAAFEEGRWEKASLRSARQEMPTTTSPWRWLRAPLAQVAFALI